MFFPISQLANLSNQTYFSLPEKKNPEDTNVFRYLAVADLSESFLLNPTPDCFVFLKLLTYLSPCQN